ncbi:uncharacterized protein ACNS7B_012181 isoform 1-T1 [Menidia menidia]
MLIAFYFLLMLTDGWCAIDPILETKTNHVGSQVTLTCPRKSAGTFSWMRVNFGSTPEILGEEQKIYNHITVKPEPGIFELRILQSKLSDTGFYFCIRKYHQKMELLTITYLRTEEPVTTAPPSPLFHQEDSVTLKCSVLHDSQNTSCPADENIFCLTAKYNQCHSSLNYSKEGQGGYLNNSLSVTAKKCLHSYLKHFSSSDVQTYYCAVATCEERVMENQSKPNKAVNLCSSKDVFSIVFYLLCAAVAMSVILIGFLAHTIKKLRKKIKEYSTVAVAQQRQTSTRENQGSQQTDEDSLIYSTVAFTRTKMSQTAKRANKSDEEETIFTDVCDPGL